MTSVIYRLAKVLNILAISISLLTHLEMAGVGVGIMSTKTRNSFLVAITLPSLLYFAINYKVILRHFSVSKIAHRSLVLNLTAISYGVITLGIQVTRPIYQMVHRI